MPYQTSRGWRCSSTTPYRSSAKLPVGTVRMTSTPASLLVFSMTFKAWMSLLMPPTRSNWSTMIKSMPGFVSPNAPLSLLLASSPEQLLTLLIERTLFVPIHLLLGTVGSISPPAISTSLSSTLSQNPTLNWRRISGFRQSAEGPFPGPITAGSREFWAIIARSLC